MNALLEGLVGIRFSSVSSLIAEVSGMSKTFRKWSPNQQWLLPPSPQDWLDEHHLVYFLMDVVGAMDLSPFYDRYRNSVGGQPPFHPQMMVIKR